MTTSLALCKTTQYLGRRRFPDFPLAARERQIIMAVGWKGVTA